MQSDRGYWYQVFSGFLIGLGCVLPGVSGGVMAVAFGLYRPMLDAVLHFFKEPKRHFAFLLPLGIGGALGFLVGAKGLNVAMARHEAELLFLFTGFIVGGVPDLLREAHGADGFKPRYLWALALGVALALPMMLMPSGGAGSVAALSPVQALLTGAVYALGTIVPGVSTSFLLIYLGWYQAFLSAVATVAVGTLWLCAVGFIATALALMKAVQWLFDRAQGYAYYGVLGFLAVSVVLVFPGFSGGNIWIRLMMLVLGLLCALQMSRLGAPKTGLKEEK